LLSRFRRDCSGRFPYPGHDGEAVKVVPRQERLTAPTCAGETPARQPARTPAVRYASVGGASNGGGLMFRAIAARDHSARATPRQRSRGRRRRCARRARAGAARWCCRCCRHGRGAGRCGAAHRRLQQGGGAEDKGRGIRPADAQPPQVVPERRMAGTALDAHPLIREHFARRLRESAPEAWREAHGRLYEHLRDSVPYWPEGVDDLQPLYQAVVHGCLAGRAADTCEQVYRDRILRGTSGPYAFYSRKRLGFGCGFGRASRGAERSVRGAKRGRAPNR
jgi:hypothetical protein